MISWQCFFLSNLELDSTHLHSLSFREKYILSVSFMFQSRKKFIQIHNNMKENIASFLFTFGWTICLKGQILLINNMLLQYNQVISSCRSFNMNGIYQQKDLGPIQQPTIIAVDPVKGRVLRASGRNM